MRPKEVYWSYELVSEAYVMKATPSSELVLQTLACSTSSGLSDAAGPARSFESSPAPDNGNLPLSECWSAISSPVPRLPRVSRGYVRKHC